MSNETKTLLFPKLRFPEFQDGLPWESRVLGPMTLKVGSGITPTGGDKNYKATGRPFVRSQNVGWGELILDDVAYIDEEMHRSFDSTEIATSDVLLNITGASIGRSAVADSRVAGGNVNQHVCIIRTKPNELNPFLLNQYLISQNGQSQIDSFQAGGNRQGLNFSQIRSFLIPLSQALSEQQRIADCLSSLDELIAAQARKLDTLKTHKKGLMQQLFPRDGETQPRLRFPEFGEPWIESKLEDLCGSVSSGRDQIDSDGLFDLYGSTSVIGKTKNASFNGERILVARVGANAGMLTKAKGSFGVTDNTLVVSLNHSIDIDFLFHYLGNININKLIFGSGQPLITGSILKNLPIQVPVDAEQRRVSACLSSLDELIIAQSSELEAFRTHKKGLMHQLFPASAEGKE